MYMTGYLVKYLVEASCNARVIYTVNNARACKQCAAQNKKYWIIKDILNIKISFNTLTHYY